MDDFPRERIRRVPSPFLPHLNPTPHHVGNLSIIAHIDHGKSTLADRLLQMTGTLPSSSSPQFLDKLKVERERGITVKAQTVSIIHTHTDGKEYLINLIDTPGHVDFSYEVSRSLGACEGGLLLVDCTQGIQAQTLSVFHHALDADLTLLPVINKVDLPHASPAETSEQIESSLGLSRDTHMPISAKSGMGVDEVLRRVVEDLPAPRKWEDEDGKLRGLVFDTFYDQFRGVVSLVRIFSGSLKKGDKVRFLQADRRYDILEVGIYNPEEVPVDVLREGQVGYVVCNMKNSEEAFIGDTVCWADKMVDPLPGFKPMKAMVYAGIFPMDSGEFPKLEEAIERLTLNDRSVSIQRESSAALSQGFRLGFLGTLHMDVFRQRLEDEYDSNVIVTAPTVPYKVVFKDGKEVFISNPAEFPDTTDPKARVEHVEEPMVNATIFVPNDYIGEMMELCSRYRGVQQEYRVLEGTDRAILRYSLPLSEIVTDFFSELKSASSGFASFDYEEAGYEQSDLVKLNMMLNGKPVDALAMIVHKSVAQQVGRAWTKKLREVLPRQLFEVAIQAAIGTRIVARETLSAVRKDVTAGLYGGHYERKLKHLNKQKEGKKRLKKLAGNIDIPQSAFFEVLSSRPRSFSTSARHHMALHPTSDDAAAPSASSDPILRLLPDDLARGDPTPQHLRSSDREYPPIDRSDLSPHERASLLSAMHRLTTAPRNVAQSDTDELYKTFIDLYLASPHERPFTPPELGQIIRTMISPRRVSVPNLGASRATDQLASVVDEVREIVTHRGVHRLEMAIVYASRYRRKPSYPEFTAAEQRFRRLFPASPPPISFTPGGEIGSESTEERKAYKEGINHLLYLAALRKDDYHFNEWWNRMSAAGFQADSWSTLARMILLHETGRTEAMIISLNAFLRNYDYPAANARGREDNNAAVVLVNYALFGLATSGRWGEVASIYARLRPGERLFPTDSRYNGYDEESLQELSIDMPRNLVPSGVTFSLLVHALAFSGKLAPGLSAMKHMIEDGHAPSTPEYAALLEGFARFGEIPSKEAGRASDLFPRLETLAADFGFGSGSGSSVIGAGASVSTLASRSPRSSTATSIWERGVSVFRTRTMRSANPSPPNPWTLEALEQIWSSFLSLQPSPGDSSGGVGNGSGASTRTMNRAPSPRAMWTGLLAWSRVTNGDAGAVWAAWEDLREVFEDEQGREKGWKGWRMDGRLRRVVGDLEEMMVEREEGSEGETEPEGGGRMTGQGW